MKILFSSYAFRPMVGGIETVSEILAEEFSKVGHEVRLITETSGPAEQALTYSVRRNPGMKELATLTRWADVLFQNNISLRSLLPAILLGTPVVVLHQTWIRNKDGRIYWNDQLKRSLLSRVTNLAISQAIANDLKRSCVVVPNPYRSDVFKIISGVPRTKALVFLGRLVSDKGIDLLLHALAALAKEGILPELTIIGEGPEGDNLRTLTSKLNLDNQVSFAGKQTGPSLATLLNQHRVMVVPSRWAEPFGVVALEGIACGCVIIGSEQGGLREAMGPGGITFKNGDVVSLTLALKQVLLNGALEESLHRTGAAHLAAFAPKKIAGSLLGVMEQTHR